MSSYVYYDLVLCFWGICNMQISKCKHIYIMLGLGNFSGLISLEWCQWRLCWLYAAHPVQQPNTISLLNLFCIHQVKCVSTLLVYQLSMLCSPTSTITIVCQLYYMQSKQYEKLCMLAATCSITVVPAAMDFKKDIIIILASLSTGIREPHSKKEYLLS